MNDQDLRDYRAYIEEQLAIMAKATAGSWDAGIFIMSHGNRVADCDCSRHIPLETKKHNATAINATAAQRAEALGITLGLWT